MKYDYKLIYKNILDMLKNVEEITNDNITLYCMDDSGRIIDNPDEFTFGSFSIILHKIEGNIVLTYDHSSIYSNVGFKIYDTFKNIVFDYKINDVDFLYDIKEQLKRIKDLKIEFDDHARYEYIQSIIKCEFK